MRGLVHILFAQYFEPERCYGRTGRLSQHHGMMVWFFEAAQVKCVFGLACQHILECIDPKGFRTREVGRVILHMAHTDDIERRTGVRLKEGHGSPYHGPIRGTLWL